MAQAGLAVLLRGTALHADPLSSMSFNEFQELITAVSEVTSEAFYARMNT
jgi:hypothetical protein